MSTNDQRVAIMMAVAVGLGLLVCCLGAGAVFFLSAAPTASAPMVMPAPMAQTTVSASSASGTTALPLSEPEFELVKLKKQGADKWLATVEVTISHPENLKSFTVKDLQPEYKKDAALLQYSQTLKATDKAKGVYELSATVGPVSESLESFRFRINYELKSDYDGPLGTGGSRSEASESVKIEFEEFDAKAQERSGPARPDEH